MRNRGSILFFRPVRLFIGSAISFDEGLFVFFVPLIVS